MRPSDEVMARAFWDALPPELRLAVEVFPNFTRQRDPYPARHDYVPLDWSGHAAAPIEPLPGLLVGDTPVTESLGLDWPLRFLSPRLRLLHEAGQPGHRSRPTVLAVMRRRVVGSHANAPKGVVGARRTRPNSMCG